MSRENYKSLVNCQFKACTVDKNGIDFTSNEYNFFTDRFISIPNFLPEAAFSILRDSALKHLSAERVNMPGHKKGGTVSYNQLRKYSPEITDFYHSQKL